MSGMRNKIEWLAIIVGPIATCVILGLLLHLMSLIMLSLREHRNYIARRDVTWEAFDQRVESNQQVILDHIRREEATWSKNH